MHCRKTGFLAVVRFGSFHAPLLKSITAPGAHRKTEKDRQLADRRGGGKELNHNNSEKAWHSVTHYSRKKERKKERKKDRLFSQHSANIQLL